MTQDFQFELTIKWRNAIIQVRRDNYNGLITVLDSYYDEDGYPPIEIDDMPSDERLEEMVEMELTK